MWASGSCAKYPGQSRPKLESRQTEPAFRVTIAMVRGYDTTGRLATLGGFKGKLPCFQGSGRSRGYANRSTSLPKKLMK